MTCEINSVSPAALQVLAAAVAERWGTDRWFAPSRAGFSERTKKLAPGETLRDRLAQAWASGRETHDLWLYMEQDAVDLVGDLRCFDALPEHDHHTIEFSFDATSGVPLDAAVDLACDLFVAIDGYRGHMDTVAFGQHQVALAFDGAARGAVPRVEADDSTTWRFDHHIDGPFWVNLFGPAFVERWGERVDDLGFSTRRLDNGGVMVMAAERPVEVDPNVTTLLGYPHQRSLADQLGAHMFRHETGSTELGPPGAAVPTRSEHIAAAQRHARR